MMVRFDYECELHGVQERFCSRDSVQTCDCGRVMRRLFTPTKNISMAGFAPQTRGQYEQREWEKSKDYAAKIDSGKYHRITSKGEVAMMDEKLNEAAEKELRA